MPHNADFEMIGLLGAVDYALQIAFVWLHTTSVSDELVSRPGRFLMVPHAPMPHMNERVFAPTVYVLKP